MAPELRYIISRMLFSLKLSNVLYLFEGIIYLCVPVFVEFHENVNKIDKERA